MEGKGEARGMVGGAGRGLSAPGLFLRDVISCFDPGLE